MDDSQPPLLDDDNTSCACDDNYVDRHCAYLNLPVPKLVADVRVTACVCGNCVSDEPSENGGPWLKEICGNCSEVHLQALSRFARLVGKTLVTEVTIDNYLNLEQETIALSAIQNWVEDALVFTYKE